MSGWHNDPSAGLSDQLSDDRRTHPRTPADVGGHSAPGWTPSRPAWRPQEFGFGTKRLDPWWVTTRLTTTGSDAGRSQPMRSWRLAQASDGIRQTERILQAGGHGCVAASGHHVTVVGETYSDHGGVESVCRENRRVRCANLVETAQGTIARQQAEQTTTPSPRAAARHRRR
jgi:hypothetical protein